MKVSEYKINELQRNAIEHATSPLLVIAGAGTGKTTTLIEKIKFIIGQKLAKPEQILCLTFTEKASYEMQERVDVAMPYGFFQMQISTFHAFADEVLRNEIHHVGLNPAYDLMTQAQSVLFMKQHLFELKLKHFRPLSNPNKFIQGLLQHFSRLQDEDISPKQYSTWISGLKVTDMFTEEDIQQYKELSEAYVLYKKIKSQNDVMDFGDLIFYLNLLLRTRPNILKYYREKFKYILVDEFQDTNIAQYELIKLLCPSSDNPKLTVVGDDSQAIYKFRGASVSNILTFMKDYKHAKQVTLNDNYRSNQSILDHAYKLIQNNNPNTLESKLGISKELISHKKNIQSAVEFRSFNHGDQEADWIADKILKLQASSYKFQDIAILVRANNHSNPIINSLKKRGIPFQFLGPGSLYKQPEVKDLIAYLQFLSDPENTISLYRVLSMEIFKLDQEDIIRLMSFSKKISQSFYQSIKICLSFDSEIFETENKETYEPHLPLITKDSKQKLIKIFSMLKRHFARINKDSAGEILYYFLEDSGYLQKLSKPDSEASEKQTLNVAQFFKKIKSIESTQEDNSVMAICNFINISLEIGESPRSEIDDSIVLDAVNIITIHGAKGLEFPIVFLPNLVAGRFPTYHRREQIPIPNDLIKEQLGEGDYHLEEERRLFYVGLTRAKDRVFLTASEIYGDGLRKKKISPFVIETVGREIVENNVNLQSGSREQLSIFDFKKHDEPVILPPLEIKNISYSQLQTYELCPLQYKYKYVLKIPTPQAAAASFGSTIHNVLHKFYKGFAVDPSWGLSHLLNLLDSTWIPVGYGSQAHHKRMKEEAREMLENFYHSFHRPEIEIVDLEKLFKIRIDSTVFLTGKIDRVDRKKDGGIEVIDYKTGNQPDDKKLQKDLQLAIYASAVSDPGLYNVPIEKIDLSFYFLQTRDKKTLTRTKEDLIDVKMRVKDTVDKIRKSEFEPKVGKWCDYCSFRMICEAWK